MNERTKAERHSEDEMSISMRQLLIESSRMPSDGPFRRDRLTRSSTGLADAPRKLVVGASDR